MKYFLCSRGKDCHKGKYQWECHASAKRFLINEPAVTEHNGALRDNPNVENYLHEAGMIHNAPSGNAYYNGNGEMVENLGAHEHWNNPAEKMYSRNLGKEEGIELVRIYAR